MTPKTGDPDWDHVLDEIDHPELVAAELAHTEMPNYGESVEVPATAIVLTPRQLEIIRIIANGYSQRTVATWCGISVNTVKTHQVRILRATHCRSMAQAVAVALKYRLLDETDILDPTLIEHHPYKITS